MYNCWLCILLSVFGRKRLPLIQVHRWLHFIYVLEWAHSEKCQFESTLTCWKVILCQISYTLNIFNIIHLQYMLLWFWIHNFLLSSYLTSKYQNEITIFKNLMFPYFVCFVIWKHFHGFYTSWIIWIIFAQIQNIQVPVSWSRC